MDLHYTISGQGETLVFIHGAFINSDIWEYQVAEFEKSYRVVNIDLRAHGRSAASDLEEYTVEFFGEDVIDLLNHLGVGRFVIAGLSLGAMIAQYVAANNPHRVQGIILVGASASMRLSLIEKTVTTLIFPKWVAMWLFGKLTIKQFLKLSFLLTWFMRGNKWLGGTKTREKIRQSIQMIDRDEIRKIYAAVHTFRKQNLKSGDFPVLIINGQYDSPVIHYHALYLMRELQERGRFLIVPNTGHACNYDAPEVFNSLIREWLVERAIFPTVSYQVNETDYTSEYSISLGSHPSN